MKKKNLSLNRNMKKICNINKKNNDKNNNKKKQNSIKSRQKQKYIKEIKSMILKILMLDNNKNNN